MSIPDCVTWSSSKSALKVSKESSWITCAPFIAFRLKGAEGMEIMRVLQTGNCKAQAFKTHWSPNRQRGSQHNCGTLMAETRGPQAPKACMEVSKVRRTRSLSCQKGGTQQADHARKRKSTPWVFICTACAQRLSLGLKAVNRNSRGRHFGCRRQTGPNWPEEATNHLRK